MQPNQPLCDIPPHLRERVQAVLTKYGQHEESGCIVWTGARTPKGYGRFGVRANGPGSGILHIRAHRAAWILANGAIDDPSLVIDHLCRNRACMNPSHLEPVTATENRRRGIPERGRKAAGATSCIHGHPWPEHVREVRTRAGRISYYCAECHRQAVRRTP